MSPYQTVKSNGYWVHVGGSTTTPSGRTDSPSSSVVMAIKPVVYSEFCGPQSSRIRASSTRSPLTSAYPISSSGVNRYTWSPDEPVPSENRTCC